MIDMHTHILPELDDGSSSIEETKKMFDMMLRQDVDTVVATPHFYIDNTPVKEFLNNRDVAVKKVKEGVKAHERPLVAVGAEVQFFADMYMMEDINQLCISGTRYLLIEMPFAPWNSYTYKALNQLNAARGIIPIIAHVERYFEFQDCKEEELLRNLKDTNSLIQINSTFLTDRPTKRRALSLIKKDLINFMGSDCHNTEYRPPELRNGFDIIYKKFGESRLMAFEYWENKIKEKLITF